MPSEINIAQHLHQWFQEYDELVIPDLGRFEANYQNALIQPGINKILPPNKEIFFDASVKSNDKKFAFYLANEENITLPEAEAQVHSFVQALKAELGMRKEYQADIFGKFVYTPQGHIEFIQNEDTVYAGSSFGLPELYNLKPAQSDFKGGTSPDFSNQPLYDENFETERQGAYQNPSPASKLEEDIIIEEEVVENTTRKWTMILSLILLLLIVGSIVFIIMEQNPIAMLLNNKNNDNNSAAVVEDDPLVQEDILNGNRSALDEEEEKDKNNENTTKDNTPKNTDDDTGPTIENPTIDYPIDESFVNSFTTKGQTPSEIENYLVKRPSTRPRYYVILGSFGNQSNAYSYLNNLLIKGMSSAKIITPNEGSNLYRIAYQDFATRQEAKEKGYAFCKQNKLKFFIFKY